MDWQEELIALYLFVSKEYQQNLWAYCERHTHYADMRFSDEEVMTLFLWGIMEKQTTLKDIYEKTKRHLNAWFPALPSYVAFIQRINRMQEVFVPLIERLQADLPTEFAPEIYRLIDSMPIIMAQRGRRFKAKVAPEIASPHGYCATKKLYYYGVKLHVIAGYEKGKLPLPEYIGLSGAQAHDLKVYEQLLPALEAGALFADKAYQKENKAICREHAVLLHTPVKKKKGQTYLDAADKLLSTAISRIRQPIESFFNWLEQTTHIQIASKVRSYNGLMVHVFGRIAAAFFMLIRKFSS
jgi:hypothetical protein